MAPSTGAGSTPEETQTTCDDRSPSHFLRSSTGSRAISAPFFCSATRSSYSFAGLSQNSALVSKKRASRKAVSPVIARCPFRISVMRFTGTSNLWRQLGRAHAKGFEIVAKRFTRWMGVRAIRSSSGPFFLVVVHNLDIRRSKRSLWPLEAHAPLIVDADAPLAFSITAQRLEAIAWACEVAQVGGGIELFELLFRSPIKSREGRELFVPR